MRRLDESQRSDDGTMYVNTNVAALNAWQNLDNTQQSLTQVLQRLSSGNRINTAADDPAGLAISQQMLTQIDGMQQAYTNAQSGISLLQTADGALNQIQNILQSMRSLASEAATATENPTDLANLQTEMNQYAAEITQITNTTQFNNVNLLGGSYVNQLIQIGANQGQTLGVSLGAADAFTLGVTGESVTGLGDSSQITNGLAGIAATGIPATSAGTAYTLTASTQAWSMSAFSQTETGSSGDVAFTTIAGKFNGTATDSIQFTVSTNASTLVTVSYTDSTHSSPVSLIANATTGSSFTLDGVTFTLNTTLAAQDTYTVNLTLNPYETSASLGGMALNSTTISGAVAAGQSFALTAQGQAFTFQAGTGLVTQSTTQTVSYTGMTTSGVGTVTGNATATLTASVTLSLAGAAATSYTNGTGNASVTNAAGQALGINISTQANAEAALTAIDNAINNLSNERANVGAYQNRLQFAASDLQTSQQNLQAARAGITEADMALEMANLTRDQILQQSGVAMLAQANAMPQALLKLLP
jgi:flagellin